MVSHDPTLPVGARLCRGCSYRLEGLVSGRCPECGRKFDKQDGRSFYSVTYRWNGMLKVAMGVAWIPVVGAGVCLVLDWLFQDPNSSLYINILLYAWVLVFVTTASLIFAYLIESQQPRGMKWRRAAVVGVVALLAWGVMVWIAYSFSW